MQRNVQDFILHEAKDCKEVGEVTSLCGSLGLLIQRSMFFFQFLWVNICTNVHLINGNKIILCLKSSERWLSGYCLFFTSYENYFERFEVRELIKRNEIHIILHYTVKNNKPSIHHCLRS